jgi:hypothetical protein
MKVTRLFASAAISAAFCFHLLAQQPSPGFHAVACFKLKPDSAAEFRKFAADELRKVSQGRVDDGELTGWYLLRSVLPQGEAAECDYVSVSFFPQLPHLLGPEQLESAIKKAGLNITPDDYIKHRNAVSKLVSVAMFQNQASVGAPKKGDYFQVNYMNVADENLRDYIALEKNAWKPFAEALVKDGKQDAWSVNLMVMPFGSDMPYQAVTVDAFPSMDAVFSEDPQFFDRFRKVHPNMEFGTTMARFEKLRKQAQVRLFLLEDMIAAL